MMTDRPTCRFCKDKFCLHHLGDGRPNDSEIDGHTYNQCGRWIRAGELVASWITLSANKMSTLRYVMCMSCYDSVVHPYGDHPLPESRFWVAPLENCMTCGYHGARIGDRV